MKEKREAGSVANREFRFCLKESPGPLPQPITAGLALSVIWWEHLKVWTFKRLANTRKSNQTLRGSTAVHFHGLLRAQQSRVPILGMRASYQGWGQTQVSDTVRTQFFCKWWKTKNNNGLNKIESLKKNESERGEWKSWLKTQHSEN